jgi:hypothetical protein
MTTRVQCCAPFCWKAWKGEPEVEQLCGPHYRRVGLALRKEYEAAWEDAEREEKLSGSYGDVSAAVALRVTLAWDAVKADIAAKVLAN